MNNSNRWIVKKTNGFKFRENNGYSMIDGFGIYDTEKNNFVANSDKNSPWSYTKKSIAQSIVDQFNTIGPADTVYYASILKGVA